MNYADLLKYPWLKPIKKTGLIVAKILPMSVPVSIDASRLYVDLRSTIGRGLLMTGEFDPAIRDAILSGLKPGDTFIDVGANVGYYTLLAAKKVGNSGHVHAFEIDPRPLRCLRKTIKVNKLNNVTLHECALGDLVGPVSLITGKECGHTRVNEATSEKCVQVKMTTLDRIMSESAISDVGLVKIDVEGGELMVIKGAENVIKTHRPTMIIEVVSDHLQKYGAGVEELNLELKKHLYIVEDIQGAHTPSILAIPSKPEC